MRNKRSGGAVIRTSGRIVLLLAAGLGLPVLFLETMPLAWKTGLAPKYRGHLWLAEAREVEFRPKIERLAEFAELLENPPPDDDPYVYSETEGRMVHFDYVEAAHVDGARNLPSWRRAIPSRSYTRYLLGRGADWFES